MNKVVSIAGSLVGNVVSFFAVALSMQDYESIVTIICAVVGLLITIVCSIVIPIVKWWRNAKKDGKIDNDELDELSDILSKGNEDINKDKKED